MNDKVIGFILKQTDYRDHAVLLSVLTKEYGRISFVAHGARKLTSKNAMNILPFTKSEFLFDYKEGKTIFRLKSANTIDLYRFVHEDLIASSATSVLCEIVEAATFDQEDYALAARFFDALEHGLQALNQQEHSDLVLSLFLSETLQYLGIEPNVDGCAICGNTKVKGISVEDGGFVCEKCLHEGHGQAYTQSQLRQFRLLNKARFQELPIVKEYVDRALVDTELLLRFLETYAGVKIRAFAFYKQLLTIE